jgi:hypothetical protein
MPFVGGRYYDDDEYWDLRQEAEADRYWDRIDEYGWTCGECGELWDPGYVPASRIEPGYYRTDCCPRCGGDPVTNADGEVVVGRQEREDG